MVARSGSAIADDRISTVPLEVPQTVPDTETPG
jgi:hypothetical protein